MKRFLVGKKVGFRNDINVGIAPGKFDTKQLILSALVVLERASDNNFVQFVRTIDKEELSKCRLFINDDFATDFPQIPSYHDIGLTWERTCKTILNKYSNFNTENMNIVLESVKEKICNLESIDCIMELYEASTLSLDSFEEALNITLKLIEKFISDSLHEAIYLPTVKANVEHSKSNYVHIPVYVQGWRSIIKNIDKMGKIEYAMFSEDGGNSSVYIVEALDKDIVMKKYVKGMADVCYSGRFFVKTSNKKAALNVIDRLPKFMSRKEEKLA